MTLKEDGNEIDINLPSFYFFVEIGHDSKQIQQRKINMHIPDPPTQ